MTLYWQTLLLFGLLFVSNPQLNAQTSSNSSLTLAESIRLALENNKQIQQTKELISGAYAKIEEARSVFYPQLQLQSNYTRLNYVSTFKFEFPGFPSDEIKLGSLNNYSAQLSLNQSLYSWERNTKSIELNEVELNITKDNAALTEREVAYTVMQLFYEIQLMQEAVKVIDNNIVLLDEHLSAVKKKYEAGELSNFDVLSTEVQIRTTTGQKIDTELNLKKLEFQFNKILGRDIKSEVKLELPPLEMPTPLDDKSYVHDSFLQRIELKQARSKEQFARLQKEITSTLNKPNINLFFNWDIKNGYLPNADAFKGNWYAGLMISYPLFDGFRTAAQVNQAEVNARAVQIEYENVKQSIETEVNQAIIDLKTAEKKLEVEKAKIEQAEEALKIANEQYFAGRISTLDLLETQQSHKNAKLNYLVAILNYRLSTYTLDRAAGRDFQIQ